MFGEWYVAMIVICLVLTLYLGDWFKEMKIKSNQKSNLTKRLACWALVFTPIVNTILALMFVLMFLVTIFGKDIIIKAVNESESLYFKEDEEQKC